MRQAKSSVSQKQETTKTQLLRKGEIEMNDINETISDDIPCPGCGAYWGHPDATLNYHNRFKVDNFCKCYNPKCTVVYYNLYTGEAEYTATNHVLKKVK